MNNEALQVIVIFIVVVLLLALALSPIIALWVYVFFQNRKRRKIRERILSGRREVIGDKRWFPVRYAFTLQFAPGNSRINWLGKCPWPNGAVSWLRFDTADQKHYFSSETGVFIFGSHKSTRVLYDEANRYFGRPAAQNL